MLKIGFLKRDASQIVGLSEVRPEMRINIQRERARAICWAPYRIGIDIVRNSSKSSPGKEKIHRGALALLHGKIFTKSELLVGRRLHLDDHGV